MVYDELEHLYSVLPWILLAAAAFVLLLFVNAPYGRHRRNVGPVVHGGLAWLVMESPAPLIFASFFIFTTQPVNLTQFILFGMWEAHYIHRTFVYPFTMRNPRRLFPLLIIVSGFIFNLVNAYLNGNSIFTHASQYTTLWLSDIRFLTGVMLFISGYALNRHSDMLLYRLRDQKNDGYDLPRGGFFRWVSCPNYLGEIVMWIGWATATWSLAGLAFAIWTVANLAPRALAHHKWYRRHFADYPVERRVLIPGIW